MRVCKQPCCTSCTALHFLPRLARFAEACAGPWAATPFPSSQAPTARQHALGAPPGPCCCGGGVRPGTPACQPRRLQRAGRRQRRRRLCCPAHTQPRGKHARGSPRQRQARPGPLAPALLLPAPGSHSHPPSAPFALSPNPLTILPPHPAPCAPRPPQQRRCSAPPLFWLHAAFLPPCPALALCPLSLHHTGLAPCSPWLPPRPPRCQPALPAPRSRPAQCPALACRQVVSPGRWVARARLLAPAPACVFGQSAAPAAPRYAVLLAPACCRLCCARCLHTAAPRPVID